MVACIFSATQELRKYESASVISLAAHLDVTTILFYSLWYCLLYG